MVNKVILYGRLGQDPELKQASNSSVVNVSLAITEKGYTAKNGTDIPDKTEWVNLVIWNNQAEVVAKWVKKGDLLYVEGKLQTRTWEKDGIKKHITEVVVSNVVLMPNKRDNVQPDAPQTANQGNFQETIKVKVENDSQSNDDGLPF